jgi:hypothetical protein
MLVVAAGMKPFQGGPESSQRLRILCWTPYFMDGVLAGIEGLFNPLGLFYVLASAGAVYVGRKCRNAEPAGHDAELAPQQRITS